MNEADLNSVLKGLEAEHVRLFIALELPPHVKGALQETQEALRSRLPEGAVKWGSPESFHLTLIFLGTVQAWEADEIAGVVARAAGRTGALELRTGRLGAFPSLSRPSVLWVGVEGALAELDALHAAVTGRLDERLLVHERGAFKPHLTLGRAETRRPALWRELGSLLATAPGPKPVAWRAEAVSLVRSELRPQGARHTPLAVFPFTETNVP